MVRLDIRHLFICTHVDNGSVRYEAIDFNYARVGGAQLGSPARGWIFGLTDYQGRLQSSYLNYEARRHELPIQHRY